MNIAAMLGVVFISLLFVCVRSDVYMQNPRGSNDRMNEESADRQNANRLFDSENNARGGYCWGPPLNYYAGSFLSIEWTAQHACGAAGNVKCNYVLQYMCGYSDGPEDIRIRDGTTTATINDNADTFNTLDSNGNYVSGMHESYSYYQRCKGRTRNAGLFTSDQNVNGGGGSTRTRQNNNGNRYGFECPEERDYYPYWAPTPWKDIAVLTNDPGHMCTYYQTESQNVKDKQYCDGNSAIDQQTCQSNGGTWSNTGAWGIPKPACEEAPYSRDNHLGNAFGGFANHYNWTIPTADTEKCVVGGKCVCTLRLRYNITSGEIEGYGIGSQFVDSSRNKKAPITQDPYIMTAGANLSLAVNTNQYGRTFQDRSHVFGILPRPNGVSDKANIWNLNVRGKRGNIVQTYPATEYDFVPQTLAVQVGDYVHFQWTGCDHNPANNEGEGTTKTDRSNIVQTSDATSNIPLGEDALTGKNGNPLFEDYAQRVLMAHIAQLDCKTLDQLLADNNNNKDAVDQDPNNCMKLNNAAIPYFNGGLIKMNTSNTFYYMSSRNNNFSNRSQKGVLIVNPLLFGWQIALIVVGTVMFATIAAAGGLFFYAHKFPHSAIATKVNWVVDKIRRR